MLQLKNAELRKIETTVDGGIKLTLYLPQLPIEELTALMLSQKGGIEDVIEVQEVKSEQKTQSQRLRAVLYRLWELVDNEGYLNFQDFYNAKIETWIEKLKTKLP